MSRRLSGINPLAYIGVEPIAPPLLTVENRAPTTNDSQNVNIGTIWINRTTEYIYMLVSLAGGVATWVQVFPAIAGSNITFNADVGSAISAGNILNVTGGTNINTAGAGNTLTFNVDDALDIVGPLTISSLGTGVVTTNGAGVFSSSAGTNGQVLIGTTAGAPAWSTLTAGANVTITNAAHSITIASSGGGGGGNLSVVTSSGTATSVASSINFLNGSNMHTVATAADTYVANLVDSPHVTGTVTADMGFIATGGNVDIQLGNLLLPHTSADETRGTIRLATNRWISDFGSRNTFIGESSGNTTLTIADATDNTAVGFSVLNLVSTGEGNTGFGDVAMTKLTTGDFNSAFGTNSLINLVSGSENTAFGYNSGSNYTGAEHSNIVVGNAGTLGETNTIRIGTQGSATGQQQDVYMAGIYSPHTPLNAVYKMAAIDVNGHIGTLANALDGQILIGSAAGSPQWARITAGANIGITNAAGSITISATGGGAGGGVSLFHTDAGDATENVPDTSITFAGTAPINTSGNNHTVTIGLTNGANGQLLIGGGAAPLWRNITSLGGTVTITNGANSINLEAGGGAGGTTTFATESGNALPAGGTITIVGGQNINTSGAGSTVTVRTTNAINLPTTTDNSNGVYKINSNRFLHGYGTNNTFAGDLAGNYTLTGSSIANTGIGKSALASMTSGQHNTALGYFALGALNAGTNNTAVGYLSMDSVTTGDYNTAVGLNSLQGITNGQYNTALGQNAGGNLTTSNSSNVMIAHAGVSGDNATIRIGTTGTATSQQSACYIAGIRSLVSPPATALVTVSSGDRLNAMVPGASGQLVAFGPTGVPSPTSLTSSTASVTITGGTNLNVRGVKWFGYKSIQGAANTGANQEVFLGSDGAFTTIYDTNGVVGFAGGKVTVTIPVTGVYNMTVQVTIGKFPIPPPPPPPPPPPRIDPIFVYVNGVQRYVYYTPPGFTTADQAPATVPWNINGTFNAGDVLTFSVQVQLATPATVLAVIAQGVYPGTSYPTSVSGFLIN